VAFWARRWLQPRAWCNVSAETLLCVACLFQFHFLTMKTKATFLALLTLAAAGTACAEIFQPGTWKGAVLGGIAGAVIGNNSGDLDNNAWKGAAIGAGAGALLGTAIENERRDGDWRGTQVRYETYRGESYRHHSHRSGRNRVGIYYTGGHPYRHHDSFYHRRYGSYYPYWSPPYVVGYSPRYDGRPSYAARGTLLGGVAGAIVGHNSGDLRHNAWRGAALGAGAGWLIGAIADDRARERERQIEVTPEAESPAETSRTPQNAPTQQATTIINNNYYGPTNTSSMSAANGLFGR
jgi:uncharacterized protein YcfJ